LPWCRWSLNYSFLIFNAFILRNNIPCRVTNLRSSLECGIPRLTRTQASRCGNTFAFGWFDFKVRPGIQQQTRVCTDSPTSQNAAFAC
jgi:hypothetical protein